VVGGAHPTSRHARSGAFGCLKTPGYNFGKTTEQFRATLHLQPFRPFKIRMADGRAFDVAHPDFVAQSHSGRTVIVFHPDETYTVLDLLLMTKLQITNGRPA
jgi:hypothetical protein